MSLQKFFLPLSSRKANTEHHTMCKYSKKLGLAILHVQVISSILHFCIFQSNQLW
jgi:hypothetical protein